MTFNNKHYFPDFFLSPLVSNTKGLFPVYHIRILKNFLLLNYFPYLTLGPPSRFFHFYIIQTPGFWITSMLNSNQINTKRWISEKFDLKSFQINVHGSVLWHNLKFIKSLSSYSFKLFGCYHSLRYIHYHPKANNFFIFS